MTDLVLELTALPVPRRSMATSSHSDIMARRTSRSCANGCLCAGRGSPWRTRSSIWCIDRRGLLRAPYSARLRRRLVSWFGPTSLAAARPRDVTAFVAGHELGASVVRRDLDVPTACSSRRRRRSSSNRIRRKVRSGRT